MTIGLGVRRLLPAVLALVTLLLVGVARGAGPPPLGPEVGTIAFSASSGAQGIDVVAGNGSDARRLARGAGPFFAWSPVGEELVFSREHRAACAGCSDLYVVGAHGGAQRRLTHSASNSNPAWSPSGGRIAFDRCRNVSSNGCAIFTIAPNGSHLHRVTPWGISGLPVWANSGQQIAFASEIPQGIYVVAADGRDLRRLTRDVDDAPVWSPDGEQLAFARLTLLGHQQARSDIYVIGSNGAGVLRLTHSGTQNLQPAWSPDGQWIAFVGAPSEGAASSCPGANAIDEIAPNGSQQRQLSEVGDYEDPVWSPDEQQIAFAGVSSEACGQIEPTRALYAIEANGSEQRQVGSLSPEAGGELAWEPGAAEGR